MFVQKSGQLRRVECKNEGKPQFLNRFLGTPSIDPFSDARIEPHQPIRILGTKASLISGDEIALRHKASIECFLGTDAPRTINVGFPSCGLVLQPTPTRGQVQEESDRDLKAQSAYRARCTVQSSTVQHSTAQHSTAQGRAGELGSPTRPVLTLKSRTPAESPDTLFGFEPPSDQPSARTT
jgi:hypothetical protein